MKKTAFSLLLLTASALLPWGCRQDNQPFTPPEVRIFTHPASAYDGGLAHAWLALSDQLIRENQLHGPPAARIYGYLGLTTWESVCRGIPGAKSLAGQINAYPQAPAVDDYKEYDWGIVLCTAMKTVVPELVDGITANQRDQVLALAALQENQMMQTGLSEFVRLDSRSLGERLGERMITRLQNDGRDAIRDIVPVLPLRDDAHRWYWAPEQAGQTPVEPIWSAVHTFVVDNAQTCASAGPLPYSETPGSAFYAEADEIRNIIHSPANSAIAYHWDDGPGRTSSPAGHWANIARQLLQEQNRNLAESAKAYCLLGLAAADTYSCCWQQKYQYYLLRPATYIREVIDAGWTPLLFTPPHPDHVSASAALGGAAPLVLRGLLGDAAFTDRTQLNSPLLTPAGGPFILPERAFASLTGAGEEQAESRVIAGVNFRQSSQQGLETGRCIGQIILDQLDFGF